MRQTTLSLRRIANSATTKEVYRHTTLFLANDILPFRVQLQQVPVRVHMAYDRSTIEDFAFVLLSLGFQVTAPGDEVGDSWRFLLLLQRQCSLSARLFCTRDSFLNIRHNIHLGVPNADTNQLNLLRGKKTDNK